MSTSENASTGTPEPQIGGPATDLIEYAAGVIAAKMKEPHTAPYHWAGALWEAGMLHAPGSFRHDTTGV